MGCEQSHRKKQCHYQALSSPAKSQETLKCARSESLLINVSWSVQCPAGALAGHSPVCVLSAYCNVLNAAHSGDLARSDAAPLRCI